MAKAFFVKTLTGLQPEDDAGREALLGLRLGQLCEVEIKRPRNLQMHRLFWKLCSTIGEAVGVEPENVCDVLKFRTGHVRQIETKSGVIKVPRSISFAKMDQAAFNTFFDRACVVVCSEWLPHMEATELRREIEQMAGGSYQAPNPKRSAA